jgi:uncharacterized membrane protein HdeD (DUF308 family)
MRIRDGGWIMALNYRKKKRPRSTNATVLFALGIISCVGGVLAMVMPRSEALNSLFVGFGFVALFFGLLTIVAGTVDVLVSRGHATGEF